MYSVEIYKCTNAAELIELSSSPCELQKLWPTLVHVHISTEVLDTLHPRAKGLCFIMKIWLVTLTDENAIASNRQHACHSEGIMPIE